MHVKYGFFRLVTFPFFFGVKLLMGCCAFTSLMLLHTFASSRVARFRLSVGVSLWRRGAWLIHASSSSSSFSDSFSYRSLAFFLLADRSSKLFERCFEKLHPFKFYVDWKPSLNDCLRFFIKSERLVKEADTFSVECPRCSILWDDLLIFIV